MKKNGECWGISAGKYPFAIIKGKFKEKCIEWVISYLKFKSYLHPFKSPHFITL